jgi:maltooligosyltrehalose trehalohydrolase
MDAQWNDDFHHAVHAGLTSEREGYYADYGSADDVARAMGQGFVYQGQPSRFRRRRFGAPSIDIPPERFVTFVQNHDQVGNRPDGARLSTLLPPERLGLAAALLLLSPGVPLLFMGEEYGEVSPFPYFVDHGDAGLLDAVRKGREAEHTHAPGGSIPDPGDVATFDSAVLRRQLADEPEHRELLDLYRDLIALRHREPALHRSSRENTRAHADGNVVTLLRSHEGSKVVAFFNLSVAAESALLPAGSPWEEVLCPEPAGDVTGGILVEPWDFRVFRARPAATARDDA